MDTPLDLRLWRPLDILQPMGPSGRDLEVHLAGSYRSNPSM